MSSYPPYGPTGPNPGPAPGGDDRTIAVLAHLSPLIAMVLSAGWLSWLGPLIVWLVWRDKSYLVRNAAATAFNFNITVWIAVVVGWILFITLIGIPVAIIVWIAAVVLQIVFSIIGAMRASRGEAYTYPMQVPILT
ncbi:DUF4870 domain-containing protein [Georgenia yuyongxinii]|nr:DUF4870 domain-containing protein [Georgenia yuyongxinii]